MNYLYHWVPKNMEGEVLHPLNILKEKFPEIYNSNVQKYIGREKIMDQVLPILNCLWNDVLHLSAIHPKVVKDALVESGGSNDIKITCYQIDPNLLDPSNAIIYLYPTSNVFEMKDEHFEVFDPNKIEKYSYLSKETNDYYKDAYSKGERPFIFHQSPHVFYKGSINVKDLPIIEV